MLATTLHLIRHGETDWNAVGRIQGHSGPGLNQTGSRQARDAARALIGTPLDAIYASDLARAFETAQIIAAALGLPAPHADPRLRERHHGDWQGKTIAELDVEVPDWRQQWRGNSLDGRSPGGETVRQVLLRVAPALDEVARRHPGGHVAVISHGGVIAILRTLAAGLPAQHVWANGPHNCEVSAVTWPTPLPIPAWLAMSAQP